MCVRASHICSERRLCLRVSWVFLRVEVTLWVKCVFLSPLLTFTVYIGSCSFTMWPPFFGYLSRLHTSSIGSEDLLAASGCALVLLIVLPFDKGLSSPGLICCSTMGLRWIALPCADRMPNALLPKDKKSKPRSRTGIKPNGHKAERT